MSTKIMKQCLFILQSLVVLNQNKSPDGFYYQSSLDYRKQTLRVFKIFQVINCIYMSLGVSSEMSNPRASEFVQ